METKLGRFTCSLVRTASAAAMMLLASTSYADPPSAGSDELFKRLDTDGNGTLAAAEITADHKALFERLVRKADIDGNRSLSREEFLAALVPSRPEKQIETKQQGGYPQADAIRYLLLTMDTKKDSWIEADEVPDDMRPVFDAMVDQLDMNENGSMDRYELGRGARQLGQIAARYVARERIDVAKELKKFDKAQGELAQRFDKTPGPLLGNLGDPRQARQAFKQFDSNSDAKLVLAELPPPVQQQFERFMRLADRDRDGGLSEREFLAAAERIGRAMSGQRPGSPNNDSNPKREARRRAKPAPAEMSAESMAAEDE